MATNAPKSEPTQDSKIELRVHLSGIYTAKGQLCLALYDREAAFLDTPQAHTVQVVPIKSTGDLTLSLGRLPAGEYALACYHDLNSNGKLDKNLLGIPTEPYGFSNKARPKFRAPDWAEAKFMLREGDATVAIQLEKW